MIIKQFTVLVLEDDPDDTQLFIEAIKIVNPNIFIVHLSNGEEFKTYFANANSELPDYVFIDINLPRINGVECLTYLSSLNIGKKIKTVMLTASDVEAHMDKCKQLGAWAFIKKPSYFNALVKCIDYCFRAENNHTSFLINSQIQSAGV
jgi:DNA-binding response OmpR family regulator